MRLILHIGSPKTGTTSIQNFMSRHHTTLLAKGILYPIRRLVTANHLLLPAGFVRLEEFTLPQNQIFLNNTSLYNYSFKSFWKCFLEDLQRHQPHTVILSAEILFEDYLAISKRPISELLGQHFDQISVVAYVRSPVSDYKSRLSQCIRAGKKAIPPGVRPVKEVIEYYEREFPGEVKVYPFEKQQLKNCDVLYDFLENNIPQALDLVNDNGSLFHNTSLSGALLHKLQMLRLVIQPNDFFPSISTRALVQLIINKYNKIPIEEKTQNSLQLRKKVEDFLRISATDYLWLKNRYGVTFSDLDYSKIHEMKNPYKNMQLLDEICTIDHSLDKRLRYVELPKSTFIRRILVLKFVLKNLTQAIYRSRLANTWVSKTKRYIFNLVTRVLHANQ